MDENNEDKHEDLKELLEENLRVNRENNAMLSKLYRSYRRSQFVKYLYWGLVIALTLGAYYLIQPYIDQLGQAYGGLKTQVEGIHSIGETIKNTF